MKALGKKVIVTPIEKKEINGIELAIKEPVKRGKVISIGSLVTSVKEGDLILFSPVYYDEIDEKTFIMTEDDVWATE